MQATTLFKSHSKAVKEANSLRSRGYTAEIRDGEGDTYAVVSWDSLHSRIDCAAETIAAAWIKDAFRTMGTVDYYLWWRQATEAERSRGLFALPIHSSEAPNDTYTRDILISNGWDKFKATREISKRMSTLPIL